MQDENELGSRIETLEGVASVPPPNGQLSKQEKKPDAKPKPKALTPSGSGAPKPASPKEVPFPKKWPEETRKEVRELQVRARSGRDRALRTFRDSLVALSLPRWAQLSPELRETVGRALAQSFQDEDHLGQWVTYLNSFGKKPITKRKFKVIAVATGMEILAILAQKPVE